MFQYFVFLYLHSDMETQGLINVDRHDIIFTDDVNAYLKAVLNNPANSFSAVFVVSDENTQRSCFPVIRQSLPAGTKNIVISPGELNKNLETCQLVWDQLLKGGADRQALLINLGGGMVTDLGGFTAATYMRGIKFLNIPTSLLGMVDASAGGKTGVDLHLYKNMIGLFAFPLTVIVDPVFLRTLPENEWRNGVAEMLKHGIIGDTKLWKKLSGEIKENETRIFDEVLKQQLISLLDPSIRVKADIVRKDPFETNERKYLNFGHTIGHAVETYSLKHDEHPLSHGEAIAIGMICESLLSVKLCELPLDVLDEITTVITGYFSLKKIPSGAFAELLQVLKADKKAEHNLMTFSLIKGLGKPVLQKGVAGDLVVEAMHFYNSLK